MIKIKEEDKQKYGAEIYHHFRRQGNHRWDTFIYRNESDIYTVVFRHCYNKIFPDGVKRSQVRDEKIIKAKGIENLRDADYPAYKDVEILKESAFYKSRVEGGIDER
ncbi:TPA: antirestriction protein ArdR [Escherichia coli]|nr:antirestriction protein ArdR [Escherichia coli]